MIKASEIIVSKKYDLTFTFSDAIKACLMGFKQAFIEKLAVNFADMEGDEYTPVQKMYLNENTYEILKHVTKSDVFRGNAFLSTLDQKSMWGSKIHILKSLKDNEVILEGEKE